jgi:hypothetical protein
LRSGRVHDKAIGRKDVQRGDKKTRACLKYFRCKHALLQSSSKLRKKYGLSTRQALLVIKMCVRKKWNLMLLVVFKEILWHWWLLLFNDGMHNLLWKFTFNLKFAQNATLWHPQLKSNWTLNFSLFEFSLAHLIDIEHCHQNIETTTIQWDITRRNFVFAHLLGLLWMFANVR